MIVTEIGRVLDSRGSVTLVAYFLHHSPFLLVLMQKNATIVTIDRDVKMCRERFSMPFRLPGLAGVLCATLRVRQSEYRPLPYARGMSSTITRKTVE